jgi:hypothetical protein
MAWVWLVVAVAALVIAGARFYARPRRRRDSPDGPLGAPAALRAVLEHPAPKNWKERGEARGRTRALGHASTAEPEATLHIKVIRADGTVEDHGTIPAQVTRRR